MSTSHPLGSIGPVPSMSLTDPAILALLAQHEQHARFTSFSYDTAWQVGTSIRALFLEKNPGAVKPDGPGIVVQIVLWTGHILFGCTVGNAPKVAPNNYDWVRGKTNVVKQFNKSSLRIGREIEISGSTPEDRGLPFPEYACHGGGFPIFIKGVEVGAIGAILVSGLPQLEDHQLIIDALVRCSHLLA